MDFIGAFDAFGKWLVGLIGGLPAKNRKLREEIRAIVGQLADDLTGGLDLVILRLRAAKRIGNQDELSAYLLESQGKLFESFREFRVCADLRNLEDRFNRAFDPTRAAVEIGNANEVRNLVSWLEDHERLIFDMIQRTWSGLDAITSSGSPASRSAIDKAIDAAIEDSERNKREVNRIAREILDKL